MAIVRDTGVSSGAHYEAWKAELKRKKSALSNARTGTQTAAPTQIPIATALVPESIDPGYAWLARSDGWEVPYDDLPVYDAPEPAPGIVEQTREDIRRLLPRDRFSVERQRENALENVKYLEEKYIELTGLGSDALSYGISNAALDSETEELKRQLEKARDVYDSYGDRLAKYDASEIVERTSGGTLPHTAEYLDFELNHAAKGQPYKRVATEYGYDTRGESGYLELAKAELKEAGYSAEQIANFVETAAREVNASLTAAQNETVYRMSQANPIMAAAMSGFSIPLRAASGLAMLQPIGGSTYTSLDTNGAFFAPMNATGAIRGGVKDKYDLNVDVLGKKVDLFDLGYDAVMGAGDAVTAAGLGGSTAARSAIMGAETAAETMKAAAERGCSRSEAMTTGLLAGLIDAAMNMPSFSSLSRMSRESTAGFLNTAKAMAKQAGIDFTQTELSETANLMIDTLKNGGASEYSGLVEEYMSQNPGASEAEAESAAAQALASRVLGDGIVASATGTVTGAAASAAGRVKNGRKASTSSHESGAVDYGEWDDNLTLEGKRSFEPDYNAHVTRQADFDADEQALSDAISDALAETKRLEGDSTTGGGVALLERTKTAERADKTTKSFDNFEIVDGELSPEQDKLLENRLLEDWNEGKIADDATIRDEGLRIVAWDDINADIAESLPDVDSSSAGIYKEVNVHGSKNTELDEVDLNAGVIYEDKCAIKLYMENPDYRQTEWEWANKQIYDKGGKRIDAVMQDDYWMSSKVSKSLPNIADLKKINKYVFRIDADTPALRQAVNEAVDRLRKEYPYIEFRMIFGGKE